MIIWILYKKIDKIVVFISYNMENLRIQYGVIFKNNYEKYFDIINDIFNNDNLNYDLNDENILNIIGLYYQYKIKNYVEMKKYFLMAIELNSIDAMNNLGNYYKNIELNAYHKIYNEYNAYDEMIKYYSMAIELNDSNAICNLSNYYCCKSMYDIMIEYLLMGIKLNNVEAIIQLAIHHELRTKNYNEMKKYYLMAVELKNSDATFRLAKFYRCEEKNYDERKKYYLMAIELNNTGAMYSLGHHYKTFEVNFDMMKKYLLMAIDSKYNVPKNEYGVDCYSEVAMRCLCDYYENNNQIVEMKTLLFKYIELNNVFAMRCLAEYYKKNMNNIEMIKYYLMAIELKDSIAMEYLGDYYNKINNYDEMKKYYLMATKLHNYNATYKLAVYYHQVENNNDEMNKYHLMNIKFNCYNCYNSLLFLTNFYGIEMQHYLLRNINSPIAIKKILDLEADNFLGVKIFKDLIEYCFKPQRLLRICSTYNVELDDYIDIV